MNLFRPRELPLRRSCLRLFSNSRHSFHSTIPRKLLDAGVWAPTRKEGKKDATKESMLTVLETAGYIYQAHAGLFHILPLGLRVLNKINRVVDENMERIGGQKVSMSCLTTQDLWQKTGRYESSKDQLFKVQDRKNSNFLLAPTHEEEITSMIAATIKTAKDLPLRLYQIGQKYRDEPRPRQGLVRGREFTMKDMYTFDSTPELAKESYNAVRGAYDRIFYSLGLPVVVAEADSGMMGGSDSHEYHILSPSGEDTLLVCDDCYFACNTEVGRYISPVSGLETHACPKCGSRNDDEVSDLASHRAIELAHTFNLETRYSLPLKATVPSSSTGKPTLLHMGCHGIGISRVLAVLAAQRVDSVGLNWGPGIAPYDVIVLARSNDDKNISTAQAVAASLRKLELPSSLVPSPIEDDEGPTIPVDVLFENRQSTRSLVWRLNDADLGGYPIIVVVPTQPKSDPGDSSVEFAEIQCRQLGIKTQVPIDGLPIMIRTMLTQLLLLSFTPKSK